MRTLSPVLKELFRDDAQEAIGLERVLTIVLPALLNSDIYLTHEWKANSGL